MGFMILFILMFDGVCLINLVILNIWIYIYIGIEVATQALISDWRHVFNNAGATTGRYLQVSYFFNWHYYRMRQAEVPRHG